MNTYSNQKSEPLTLENLKKLTTMITEQEEKPLPKGLSWFTKLMAKFGWHRKYEMLIFDKKALFEYPYFPPKYDI